MGRLQQLQHLHTTQFSHPPSSHQNNQVNITVADHGRSVLLGLVVELADLFEDPPQWHVIHNASMVEDGLYVAGGLVADHDYSLRASVSNVVGFNGTSPAVPFRTTSATPPTMPLGFDYNATGGMITLFWRPPADTGGVAITGYTVVFDGDIHQLPLTARQFVQGTLPRNSVRPVNVTAINAATSCLGRGEPADTLQAETTFNATAPSPPRDLRCARHMR